MDKRKVNQTLIEKRLIHATKQYITFVRGQPITPRTAALANLCVALHGVLKDKEGK